MCMGVTFEMSQFEIMVFDLDWLYGLDVVLEGKYNWRMPL